MANPTLEDLKSLGASLPPNFQIATGEVATLVSALAAVATHGEEILKAAENGSTSVAQFIHDHIAKQAEADGNPAPEKGRALIDPSPAPVAPAPSAGIDYDALAAAMVRAQANRAAEPEHTGPPPVSATQSAPEDAPPADGAPVV